MIFDFNDNFIIFIFKTVILWYFVILLCFMVDKWVLHSLLSHFRLFNLLFYQAIWVFFFFLRFTFFILFCRKIGTKKNGKEEKKNIWAKYCSSIIVSDGKIPSQARIGPARVLKAVTQTRVPTKVFTSWGRAGPSLVWDPSKKF